MMPQRRFSTMIEQAFLYQRTNCLYHNAPYTPDAFSLYSDHNCPKEMFPLITSNILKHHIDEVWNLKWSNDGQYLATAGRDKSAIIWHIGVSSDLCVDKEWLNPDMHLCSRKFRHKKGSAHWSGSLMGTSTQLDVFPGRRMIPCYSPAQNPPLKYGTRR